MGLHYNVRIIYVSYEYISTATDCRDLASVLQVGNATSRWSLHGVRWLIATYIFIWRWSSYTVIIMIIRDLIIRQ